ncbi:MAG TPA: MerR family transcriptional regulator [Flavipsychrobacter sp.]
MLIGELSKLTGFSRHTIRYYEKEGLFKLGRKHRQVNNYKDYPEDVLKKLLIIKKLKGFGFTLNESADLLAMIEENQASCNAVSQKVDEKVQVIDKKIEELMQIKHMLQNGVALCLNGCEPADQNCTMVIP